MTLGAMSALLSQNKSFGRAWHSILRRTPGMALLWMGRCDRRDDICDQPTYPLEVPRSKRSYCGGPRCGESHDLDRNLSFIHRPGTFTVWPSASTIKRSHSLHRQRDSCTVAMILWLTVLRSHHSSDWVGPWCSSANGFHRRAGKFRGRPCTRLTSRLHESSDFHGACVSNQSRAMPTKIQHISIQNRKRSA
jgi:hypothetical protein